MVGGDAKRLVALPIEAVQTVAVSAAPTATSKDERICDLRNFDVFIPQRGMNILGGFQILLRR
jgi:hypothetical protein